MVELFNMGGPLFMVILSLQLAGVIIFSVRYILKNEKTQQDLDLIKSVGVFAAVTGILGQLIGLFDAFKAIEQMGSVAPALLAGGLKVSMITTIYGMIILFISYVIWLILFQRK